MIEFKVNNGLTISLRQYERDGVVEIMKGKGEIFLYDYSISAGDFVMLLNLYHYIKDNDIQNDFINPDGENKE